EEPLPPGPISYVWSVPRAKAMRPEVLIAYQMNGRDLPRDHGFPVRAIVPGHYGMASVKWLTRIEAVREPFHGYWQTSDYAYWAWLDGKPVRRALGEMKLKSEIARPRVYETLVPNRIYTIAGTTWAGETDVTEVAVSTDGGQTWTEADFLDPMRRHAWRRWEFDWLTPKKPGRYTLLAPAKDAVGALVSKYSFERFASDKAAFDVKLIHTRGYRFLTAHEGQTYLRGGLKREWRNDDLQSFTVLRFMPPELMGYAGRSIVVDPDVF